MLSNETEAYNVPVATELLSDEWSYSKDEGTIQKKKTSMQPTLKTYGIYLFYLLLKESDYFKNVKKHKV